MLPFESPKQLAFVTANELIDGFGFTVMLTGADDNGQPVVPVEVTLYVPLVVTRMD